jgi:hypothetical protein
MADNTFSTLWEAVDYDLHKIINILKGAISVGEYSQHDAETVLGLIYVALEKVEEAQEELEALRRYHYTTEKEPEKPAAPPTKTEGQF